MGSNRPEIENRTQAATRVFYAYARRLFSKCFYSFKRTVFRGVVLATLFSASPALALTSSDYVYLDKWLFPLLRKLLQGRAVDKVHSESSEDIEYDGHTDREVCGMLYV